jgi:hypothetical protein
MRVTATVELSSKTRTIPAMIRARFMTHRHNRLTRKLTCQAGLRELEPGESAMAGPIRCSSQLAPPTSGLSVMCSILSQGIVST